jgi:four helix bundle protein
LSWISLGFDPAEMQARSQMPEARYQKSEARQMPDLGSQKPGGDERGNTRILHFTDLIVWQKAYGIGIRVFALSRVWPREEKFALTDQVRCSLRSISANIAEAWGKRRYEAHFISKLSDADTELLETENWLMYARDHGYLIVGDFESLHATIREIGKMLGAMMQSPTPFLLRQARQSN